MNPCRSGVARGGWLPTVCKPQEKLHVDKMWPVVYRLQHRLLETAASNQCILPSSHNYTYKMEKSYRLQRDK